MTWAAEIGKVLWLDCGLRFKSMLPMMVPQSFQCYDINIPILSLLIFWLQKLFQNNSFVWLWIQDSMVKSLVTRAEVTFLEDLGTQPAVRGSFFLLRELVSCKSLGCSWQDGREPAVMQVSVAPFLLQEECNTFYFCKYLMPE